MTTIKADNLNAAAMSAPVLGKRKPLVVRAGQQAVQKFDCIGPGITGACLVGADQTGGVFSVVELAAEPGAAVPSHIHSREDETFYILEGAFEVQRGNETIEMAAGMALHGPRGVVHGLRCVSCEPGRGLLITTPGGLENCLGELSSIAGETSVFGDEADNRLAALLVKYGIDAGPEAAEPRLSGHLSPSRFMGLGNHRGHVLISSDETKGALVLADLEVDPKGGLQPHLHRLEEEIFYVLEGTFKVRLGDEVIEAGAGDFVFAPRGTVHCWSNIGDTPAYALVLIAPAENFQNFAVEMEKLVARIGEDTALGNNDPQVQQEIAGLYERHSMELVGPDETIL